MGSDRTVMRVPRIPLIRTRHRGTDATLASSCKHISPLATARFLLGNGIDGEQVRRQTRRHSVSWIAIKPGRHQLVTILVHNPLVPADVTVLRFAMRIVWSVYPTLRHVQGIDERCPSNDCFEQGQALR